MNESRWISFSVRLYTALLVLYPPDYRREYGPWMRQLFRDVLRDKYRAQGWFGVSLWWLATLRDLTLSVIEQRKKGWRRMSKSTWIQMTGLLLMIGGGLSALAAFSQLQPDDHYIYYGVYQVLFWLLFPGILLIGAGCIGLAWRYQHPLGILGQWTLFISTLGALIMAVGAIIPPDVQDSLRTFRYVGFMLHATGLTAFGLIHLRTPFMPIFRALPLQIAIGWMVILTGVLRTNSQTANNLLTFLFFFGIGLGWLAIGQTLHRLQTKEMLTGHDTVMPRN